MHLAPTDEQQAIQAEARRFLSTEITRERRLAWDGMPEGHDPDFWRAVGRLGWLGFALPESVGGHGASLLDLGLFIQDWRPPVAPLGLVAAVGGGLALDVFGADAQRQEWLPSVARGERLVTLAVAERCAALSPTALETTLTRRGDALRVDGEKRFVLQGVTADAFLVAARDGDGVSAVLGPATAPRVVVASISTFAKDRHSTGRLNGMTL